MLAHNVFFSLHDRSQASVAKMLAACRNYLTGHAGTQFFACGTPNQELNRPVIDRDFDIALLIVFDSKQSHDAYQEAPAHEQFIRENKASWRLVRVFDSDIEPTPNTAPC
jgi:hypothetical protein